MLDQDLEALLVALEQLVGREREPAGEQVEGVGLEGALDEREALRGDEALGVASLDGDAVGSGCAGASLSLRHALNNRRGMAA